MQVTQIKMNKNIHDIALQAWNDKASYSAEAEEWMAEYISRVVELTVKSSSDLLLSNNKELITKFGPITTQVLKEAVKMIEQHFDITNEKDN